jgi:putative PIN family toxin of toxin-antitoxin system
VLYATVDTNVALSGIIKAKSIPGRILDGARDGRFALVTSEPLVEELQEAANTAQIKNKYPHVAREMVTILPFLRKWSIGRPPQLRESVIDADPEDNHLIECAFAAKVDCIVTGDRHLLDLKEFRGIPILTPRRFVGILYSEEFNA